MKLATNDRFTGTERNLPQLYTCVAVFLFGALSLVVPSGYSLGAVLLLLGGLGLIVSLRIPAITRADVWIIAALLGYVLVTMAEAWWDGQGSKGFDKPSRFLLAIPALFWVLRYPPKLPFLWSGFAIGALGAGTWAAWQKLVVGVERAQGHTHVIQFGNLSMLLGVLCLAGLGWAVVQRQRKLWVCLLLLGAVAGILGSLFSGSRGGWVGFPIVLLVLYRAYGRNLAPKLQVIALVAMLVGGMTVYAVPQLGVQGRVHQAVEDVGLYISGENRGTSVGARFEMWRGAALLIQEKPITGWGSNGYKDAMWQLGEEGVIDTEAAQYGHAHNEFVDAFAKRGIIGFIVLLALYLIPMRLFSRQLQAPDLSTRALATAGVLLPVTYIDFGLSQAFLTHNSGVMVYAFLLVILWGSYRYHLGIAKPL
ncbi:O-antigen ligase family protein [Vreelandella olivaria]|uniref:O-antigen ligase family protein n=1 Tax=Vreelandella olivaria TaxID=390919 RepID=UPI00201F4229|nr:O-antigen ligase family protein [Halomonas olivaria]